MPLQTPQGQPSDDQRIDYVGVSVPNAIGYRFTDLDPSTNIYIQRDDVLVVQSTSSVAGEVVTIGARVLLPGRVVGRTQPDANTVDNSLGDSPFGFISVLQKALPVVGTYTTQTIAIPLAEGYLLSVTASSSGATTRGQTFVKAWLVRGSALVANSTYMLFSDYVNFTAPIGWPFGRAVSSLEGPGNIKVVTINNPAAGVDFSYAPTLNSRGLIRSVQAQFNASAAAANRNIAFQLFDGVTPVGTYVANAVVIAAQTAQVTAAPGIVASALIPLDLSIVLPSGLTVIKSTGNNESLISVTQNIQALDQWNFIRIQVEEWLDV